MSRNASNRVSQRVANRLKMVRQARALSLDKAAAQTGVSKAMLGQIERGESSPTIATLWKIATGLGTSFSSFLSEGDALAHSKEESDSDAFINDTNMKVKTLFAYNCETGFEVFELQLLRCHEQHSSAHQLGVLEHIHVTKGTLSVLQDGCWKTYEAGSQCVLHADQPHGYRDEVGDTRFIVVIHYPM